MVPPTGYESASEVRRNRNHRFYKALRTADSLPVIIKVPLADNPAPADVHRLNREFALIRDLEAPGIIRGLEFKSTRESAALILEDFGGVPISELSSGGAEIRSFLSIALRLTEILGFLHRKDIIHCDINSRNILMNSRTGELKLTDFHLVSLLGLEHRMSINPTGLDGSPDHISPEYISPEQTGRMNRSVDYRCDYYSLGVVLYELLTGTLPFVSADPLELAFRHATDSIEPPIERRPNVPPAISRIIMKLLAKAADDRYRGEDGLHRDLLRCREELSSGLPCDFKPGKFDVSARFRIPDKLYGRKSEMERLTESFAEVRRGAVRLVLVRGFPGIGKSTLVHEMRGHILSSGGVFAGGNFRREKRDVVYDALLQAFQVLVRAVLRESQSVRTAVRGKLSRTLGANARILTDFIPELELIIGPRPEPANIPPAETRNRLHLVLRGFLRCFAHPERPLVLFLDDLQWADAASLDLIRLFVRDVDAHHLLVVCAYRDNRSEDLEILEAALTKLRSANRSVSSISLRPLSTEHVRRLVMDTLLCDEERARSLTRLTLVTTGGNPFFVIEFLRALHRRGLLKFDHATRRWEWSTKEIEEQAFTDNIVDLLAGNIRGLSPDARELLLLAACLGNTFQLNMLVGIGSLNHEDCVERLWEAMQSGIILPMDKARTALRAYVPGSAPAFESGTAPSFRFLHDRVQQAAYSLIDEEDKRVLHLDIARHLLRGSGPPESLFALVNHLNTALELIKEPGELLRAARMNLAAGTRARVLNAYEEAVAYLEFARAFLRRASSDPWKEHYEFTFQVHSRRAEFLYLARDFERSEQVFDILLKHARTRLEKAESYYTKTILLFGANDYARAINTARTGLRLFNIRIPRHPGLWSVQAGRLRVRHNLGRRDIRSLYHEPEMNDPEQQAALKLMAWMCPPAYITNPRLFEFVVLRMVNLSLRGGSAPETAYAYAAYGVLLAGKMREYQAAHEFGNLALRLVDKFNHIPVKASILTIQTICINHWVIPLRANITMHRPAYEAGIQSGDIPHASYALCCGLWQRFMAGENLNLLEREYRNHTAFIRSTQDEDLIPTMSMLMAMLRRLRDPRADATRSLWFFETSPPPGTRNGTHEDDDYSMGRQFRDIACMVTTFFQGRYEDTLRFSRRALETREASTGQITEVLHCFYQGLAAARLYHERRSRREKARLRRLTRASAAEMRDWAALCPENFAGKYLLLLGELEFMAKRTRQAAEFFNKAKQASKSSDFPHETALACESAAAVYLAGNRRLIALTFAGDALYYYEQWGAYPPIHRLRNLYPELRGLPQDRGDENDGIPRDSKKLDALPPPRT